MVGGKATLFLAGALTVGLGAGAAKAQQEGMSFFVTSVGSGNGADLRGLEGADRHCAAWRARTGTARR